MLKQHASAHLECFFQQLQLLNIDVILHGLSHIRPSD